MFKSDIHCCSTESPTREGSRGGGSGVSSPSGKERLAFSKTSFSTSFFLSGHNFICFKRQVAMREDRLLTSSTPYAPVVTREFPLPHECDYSGLKASAGVTPERWKFPWSAEPVHSRSRVEKAGSSGSFTCAAERLLPLRVCPRDDRSPLAMKP